MIMLVIDGSWIGAALGQELELGPVLGPAARLASRVPGLASLVDAVETAVRFPLLPLGSISAVAVRC